MKYNKLSYIIKIGGISVYTVIDAHCDTAAELLDRSEKLRNNSCMVNVEFMKKYNSYIQFFAAYVSKKNNNPMLRAVEILDKVKEEIEKNDINLILKHSDLEETIKEESSGAILAIEDARVLCGSLASLRFFYEYGVRAITLAWNDNNEVTDGANSNRNAGLTEFGIEVVKEMNKLGMIIDVSHITETGFYDVLATSNTPVMASHSNCYSLCNHRRNLKDEQIKALVKNKGIMCINIYPAFLEKNPDDASVDSIIRHIDYALSLGCENNLGLGSDFDGIDTTPKGISNLKDYEKLFSKMLNLGYNKEIIDKITFKNISSFIKRVEEGACRL